MINQLESVEVPPGAQLTLASLAYINVTWETSRASYLDNFVPFALEALRSKPGPMLASEARSLIHVRFGIQFPVGVVESLFERAIRTRKVRRIPGSGAVVLARGLAGRLPDLSAEQGNCRRQQGYLVSALLRFAADRFGLAWEEDAAEEALLGFIESNAVSLLDTSVRGTDWEVGASTTQDHAFVVSTFISEIAKGDPDAFSYLDGLVKGSMLASVLYVVPTGQVSRKFKHTVLLVDTPVALRVLGYEGHEARDAAVSMLHVATQQGAKLGCFRHTVKEMRGVLHGATSTIGRSPGSQSGPGGVSQFFRDSGATRSDVEFAIANLERDLERLRIQIFDVPEYEEHLGVDEDALETTLQEQVRYREAATRLADLQSLTAIHRWRRGQSDCHLETCRAVLITNNRRLVRASRKFFNAGHHQWPLCMMDSSLSALLWVKAPQSIPDLPKRQIVADCFSALAPSQALWSRFLAEISRLESRGTVDADGVALLRYSHEAQQAVMEATLGDAARITEESVQATLTRAREAASAQAVRERDEAVARIGAAEGAEASSRFEAARQSAEALALASRVECLERRERERVNLLTARYGRRVDIALKMVKAVAALVLVASAFVGVSSLIAGSEKWLIEPFAGWVRLAACGGAILGVWTLWRGDSVLALLEKLRDWLLTRQLRREGLPSHPDDA